MNKALALQYLFPDADPDADFIVAQVGQEQIIQRWELPDPQPSTAELEAAWLECLKTQKRAEIKEARGEFEAGGVDYDGHTYASDQSSQAKLTGLVSAITAGVPAPNPLFWEDVDGVPVAHDAATIVALAGAMLAHVNSGFGKSWQLNSLIDAASTEAEVAAINWDSI